MSAEGHQLPRPVGALFGCTVHHMGVTSVIEMRGELDLAARETLDAALAAALEPELVTTVVGPGNNATFKKPAQSQKISAGDVVVIPAGVYHGFSEVPDHIEYVSIRPDVEKVLPGGYVNPLLKK